jgi:uncharacterized protein (TIGR03067 family)
MTTSSSEIVMKIVLCSLIALAITAVGCSGSASDKPTSADKTDPVQTTPIDVVETKSAVPVEPKTTIDPEKLKQEELAKLQGTWIVVGTTALGITLGEKELAEGPPIKFVMDGEKYTDRFQGSFTIDPTKTPKWFDKFPSAESTSGDRKQLGIYEFDGDRLKICMAVPSLTERPKDFDPADNPGHLLFIYKKAAE